MTGKNLSFLCIRKEDVYFCTHKVRGVAHTGNITSIYLYYNLLKTKEALRRNMKPGTYIKREKTLKGKYDKRNVKEDGNTEPIEL